MRINSQLLEDNVLIQDVLIALSRYRLRVEKTLGQVTDVDTKSTAAEEYLKVVFVQKSLEKECGLEEIRRLEKVAEPLLEITRYSDDNYRLRRPISMGELWTIINDDRSLPVGSFFQFQGDKDHTIKQVGVIVVHLVSGGLVVPFKIWVVPQEKK